MKRLINLSVSAAIIAIVSQAILLCQILFSFNMWQDFFLFFSLFVPPFLALSLVTLYIKAKINKEKPTSNFRLALTLSLIAFVFATVFQFSSLIIEIYTRQ